MPLMSNKTGYFVSLYFGLAFLLFAEIFYLSMFDATQTQTLKEKKELSVLVGLPDLALSNEPQVRHRSLAGVFEIYSLDGALREHSYESFVYSVAKEPR